MSRALQWLVLGVLGATIAAPAAAINLTEVNGRLECPNLGNTHECAQFWEAKFLATYPSIIRRINGVLRIRRINGEWFSIPGECAECSNALDLQGERRFVSVREQWSEGNTWQVFDRLTGRLTLIDGYPLVSPDGRFIVAAATDLDAGFSRTVLKVYEVSEAGLKLAYNNDQGYEPKWGPTEVRWKDAGTIALKSTIMKATGDYVSTPASLVFDAGVWKLSR